MSGEEDLYLNQSDAEALFFSDALLGNADELDFESFGDASGLDVSFFFRHMLCFSFPLVFVLTAVVEGSLIVSSVEKVGFPSKLWCHARVVLQKAIIRKMRKPL